MKPISRNASTSTEGHRVVPLHGGERCRPRIAERIPVHPRTQPPALRSRTAAAIAAARWRFTDAAHSSRLLESAFGQSPREYRHVALASAWRPVWSTG